MKLVNKPILICVFFSFLAFQALAQEIGGDSSDNENVLLNAKPGAENHHANSERPNILLLVAEDLSPRIGAFGDQIAVTPHIDQLAQRGVRYTNTFTTAGVCAPSRAALITGVHQNTLGAGHMRSTNWEKAEYMAVPPPEVKAFPELLRAAGYFTYVNKKLDYQFSGDSPGSGPFTIWDQRSRKTSGVSWRDRTGHKPFFGMYTFMATHEGGVFPRCCWPKSIMHIVMGTMHTFIHRKTELQIRPEQVSVPPYYPDTSAIRRDIAQQYNNIITMDRQVGEVLSQLKADGLAESTIVIWTTDHGDGLPRAKRELFDSGLKVPMVIYWPEQYRPMGVKPGGLDSRLVSFVDLAPTILKMARTNVPGFVQGRDFVTPDSVSRKYIYAARDRLDETRDRQRAVRDKRYKYIRNYYPELSGAQHLAFRDDLNSMNELWRLLEQGRLNSTQRLWFEPRQTEELYDNKNDPFETNNLVGKPEFESVLKRMRIALSNWQRVVPDQGATDEGELAEKFWPSEIQPTTSTPKVSLNANSGEVTLTATTDKASLGYRVNGGAWLLYTQPVTLLVGETLTAKSVRYGWEESAVRTVKRKD